MAPKVLRTVFFTLGLTMLWLGFFCNYKLNGAEGTQNISSQQAGQFETYTLSNNEYSEELVEELRFNSPGEGDKRLIYQLNDFPDKEVSEPEYINQAGFGEDIWDFGKTEEIQDTGLPWLLAIGGLGFLVIGVLFQRRAANNEPTIGNQGKF